MNTNKLKKFAQETRRKLLKQVNGKLEHVLTVESGNLMAKADITNELKKDLNRMGREALMDKIAYTWFNRFVALRYMDVRGFQPLEVSVLTPKEGQVSPEILQEAMAGHISDDLKVDCQKVMDLLDGRIESSNAENDAFRLLLVGVCNHLHHIFPFLFERIDDYSELLLPDDLTSEFSIVRDVIEGMTAEDCQQVEILGWLYQFYISEKKDEVFASKGKVTKEEIPAATQLFTPRWIVEYMVQNTVGKLWVLNHPNSRLKEKMEYYIESEVTAEDVLTIDKPEELTLLDQACGSGHILVYGFELLYKIYEEEGYAPSDIPRLIIEHNLHGFEIDERAAQLAGLAILMKAREHQRRLFRKPDVPEPNITCFEDLALSDEEIKAILQRVGVDVAEELFHDLLNMQQATNFGSLIAPHASLQEIQKANEACKNDKYKTDLFEKEKLEYLGLSLDHLENLVANYATSVANPPYLGGRKMNRELSKWAKTEYPESKTDLFSCFIERSMEFIPNNGFSGLVTMESWMFLSSFEKFRKYLLDNFTVHSLSHFGWHIMRIAFGTVSFILQKTEPNDAFTGVYSYMENDNIDKNTERPKEFPVRNNGRFNRVHQKNFEKIPGSPIGYWVSNKFIDIFDNHTTLGEETETRQGLASGDNDFFIRRWQETSYYSIEFGCSSITKALQGNKKWFPFNKGGRYRRWFGNLEYIIPFNKKYYDLLSKSGNNLPSKQSYFKRGLTWTAISSGDFSVRKHIDGAIFSNAGMVCFSENDEDYKFFFGLLNSKVAKKVLKTISPTLNYNAGDIKNIPVVRNSKTDELIFELVNQVLSVAKCDWNKNEYSWDFQQNELIRFNKEGGIDTLEDAYDHYRQYWANKFFQLHHNEEEMSRQFIEIYGLQEELTPDVPLDEITILQEELDRKRLEKLEKEFRERKTEDGRPKTEYRMQKPDLPFRDKEVMQQFISYAVGCMFGRYSLDKEGLILANQGEGVSDYYEKVSKSADEVQLQPDESNIIPVLDDEWFEDDITGAFFRFIKASFGETHFHKNVTFIEDILGKDIRSWFAKEFYKDHITRYKKRPIYWKFSSPKGHFSVLVYMHRYTPDTLNIILNTYLREYINKLSTRKEQMQHLENTGSATEKAQAAREIDRLNKMIADCQEYEREILYPLATERIPIDLDDGVLVNYNLFGKAIEQVPGLNDPKAKKKVKGFDWIDGSRVR